MLGENVKAAPLAGNFLQQSRYGEGENRTKKNLERRHCQGTYDTEGHWVRGTGDSEAAVKTCFQPNGNIGLFRKGRSFPTESARGGQSVHTWIISVS